MTCTLNYKDVSENVSGSFCKVPPERYENGRRKYPDPVRHFQGLHFFKQISIEYCHLSGT
jgi:hypothetical protein